MKKEEFIIKKEEKGIRIDKFLAQKFIDFSRVYFQKLIRKGKVLINGKNNDISYILKDGDIISIDFVEDDKIDMSSDPEILKSIEIVYEDDDLLVINKPAGLAVHPSITNKSHTLVNGLLARWPNLENAGEDKMRPGIVHRLDKDTSGLMIIAKNNESFFYFKKLFQTHKVVKHYLALVWGKIEDDKGVINFPIMRSKSIPIKQIAVRSNKDNDKIGAREAITEYKVLKRFKKWTFIEAYPKTGRMHQIRVHFKAIGHPIANDKKYAFRDQESIIGLNRHFLHASHLKFISPKGRNLEFDAKLPEDLLNAINSLSGPILES